MISTFNLTKLNHLLKDFYTITRIRITVFDDALRELAAYPGQCLPALPDHTHRSRSPGKLCALRQARLIDFQELEAAAAVYPVIPAEYITSASHILEAVASYLCLEQMTALKHKELPVRIDEYLSAHYTEEISAASICEQVRDWQNPSLRSFPAKLRSWHRHPDPRPAHRES